MRKILLIGLLLIIGGCKPQPAEEIAPTVLPINLSVEVDDARMTLAWTRQGEGAIVGYNIYISEERLVARYPGTSIDPSVVSYNSTPFPGDTNPDDGIEYFEATRLDNGVRYYVSIRVVYPDQSLSQPSNEVEVVCGPRGEIELAVRYRSENDGFSFERNDYVRADASDNDLYFFSKDGLDYLGSPSRLNDFINDTRLLVLPYRGTFEEVRSRVAESKLSATDDRVTISAGDWVLLKCNTGTHALVNVKRLDGDGRDRTVKLFYAYSAWVGEVFF